VDFKIQILLKFYLIFSNFILSSLNHPIIKNSNTIQKKKNRTPKRAIPLPCTRLPNHPLTLYRNMDLTVHCKSKNDDLGVHTLKPNATYEFDFKPNFWGRTRYFCNFQWKYANGTEESFWFDIYKYSRDSPRCGRCLWRVDSAAPCQYDLKTLEYDICYDYHS
jgi:hypothetical protein